MTGFLCVGLGGAVGAMLRYAISLIPYNGTFPILTLITNIIGAFLIGLVVGAADRKGLSEGMVLFLKTGLCGGFTTFSTFSLESYHLFQLHRPMAAVLYMVLSVSLCLLGILCGMMLARRV